MTTLLTLSRWLARYTSPFIILIAIIAFFVPDAFGWVQQGQRASIILGLIMLTMGCTLSMEDFRILLARPVDILIGAVAQYTIMPLVAWTLANFFHVGHEQVPAQVSVHDSLVEVSRVHVAALLADDALAQQGRVGG